MVQVQEEEREAIDYLVASFVIPLRQLGALRQTPASAPMAPEKQTGRTATDAPRPHTLYIGKPEHDYGRHPPPPPGPPPPPQPGPKLTLPTVVSQPKIEQKAAQWPAFFAHGRIFLLVHQLFRLIDEQKSVACEHEVAGA